MSAKFRIQTLVSLIIGHNYNYYVLDEPSVTDPQFDALLEELKGLEKEFPQFILKESPTQHVGHPIVAGHFSPMKHRFEMLSLDNSLTVDALIDWTIDISGDVKDVLKGEHEVRIEWKMDGLSLDLIYHKGILLYAVTRGDGTIGENVTLNALQIPSIPKYLKEWDTEWVSVRGEVVANLAHYHKLNAGLIEQGKKAYANPRNYAAGSLRQKDPAITAERGLEFYAYSYTPEETEKVDDWNQEQDLMMLNGFRTAYVGNWNQIAYFDFSAKSGQHCNIPAVVNGLQALRSSLPFEVDGLVIKIMNHSVRKHLGFTSKFPRWATAYKFPATEGETELLDIEYQIGRTGKATPVARIAPVLVHGTTISNVTLHNRTQIERLKLYKGCKVIVKRAGDVIPQIVGTVDPWTNQELYLPLTKCPCCDSNTSIVVGLNGEQDFCNNKACTDRQLAHLNYVTERKVLDIKGLGPAVIKSLWEAKNIEPYYALDLLLLKAEDFMSVGLSELMATKLAEACALANAKLTLQGVIMSFGIDNVAEGTAERLARHFQRLDAISVATVAELEEVPDIGDITAKSIFEYFDNDNALFNESPDLSSWQEFFSNGRLVPAPMKELEPGVLGGASIVVTGSKFSGHTRKEVEAAYKSLGAKITSNVTSKTAMVVCGTKYTTHKLESAKELNVPWIVHDETKIIEQTSPDEVTFLNVVIN